MTRAGVILAVSVVLFACEARAQEYIDGGFLLGWGLEDEYGFGFGGSLGTEFDLGMGLFGAEGLHLGARAIYHVGASQRVELDNIVGEIDTNVFYFAAELGLTWFTYRGWMIRPFALIGSAGIRVEGRADTPDFPILGSSTDQQLLLAPGLLVNVPLGRFVLGLEGEYLFVDGADSFAFYGMISSRLGR